VGLLSLGPLSLQQSSVLALMLQVHTPQEIRLHLLHLPFS
jgi:hypothetical protein